MAWVAAAYLAAPLLSVKVATSPAACPPARAAGHIGLVIARQLHRPGPVTLAVARRYGRSQVGPVAGACGGANTFRAKEQYRRRPRKCASPVTKSVPV